MTHFPACSPHLWIHYRPSLTSLLCFQISSKIPPTLPSPPSTSFPATEGKITQLMEAGRSQSCTVGGPKRRQTVICVCVHYRSRQNEHIGQGPTIFSKGDDFVFVLWPLNHFAESTEWEDGHAGRWL